ncbi:leucyl aminopeptidase family protein [Pseudogracilibacillus auburnensis]|uniref:leucyl aminopeptidase family protein n=1 Tax=Pseudogracilibacillus auburnensis TaxID=1494959 RepID=UPI001A96E658|nr:leucyl aminopeptidase family protein [Pseudogracilibacillus auburnensis]MBO1001602.1 leucyl aminopeptidase family protein [Pseudogracilibacillus auburnensis]
MGIETKVTFQTEHSGLQDFVKNSVGDYVSLFVDNELLIIVKEVKAGNQTYEKIRMLAGDIARELTKRKIAQVSVKNEELFQAFSALDEQKIIIAFVEGWQLGGYSFESYKSKKSADVTTLTFSDEAAVKPAIIMGRTRAAATAFSRDLMNEIPSTLNPESFPHILEKEFADTNVNVIVHDKQKLQEMQMNGLLTVNRGSKYDPAFIELHYEGDATKPLIALVGKGVTFDTGGISLKSGRDLSDMRMDMGGAAAVAGAVKLLAESNAKVNVVGLIQTVENMPDQHSILPGDIITYKNGHTVQVGNTDAEGRLILADGLIRSGELQAEYVIDIATLTGAIAFALGPKLGGIFGEEELLAEMKKIGDENGDFVWPMPLVDDYDRTLKSNYADFSNISNQASGGSITAALFLRRFVPESTKWIHVDMAGVMESKEKGYYGNSATGFGARLLADYAVHVSK